MQTSFLHRIVEWRKHRRDQFVERWPRKWQRAPWRFAFAFGVVGWALPVFFGSWIFMHLAYPGEDLSFIDWTVWVTSPIALGLGLLYGRCVWLLLNREHTKAMNEGGSGRRERPGT